MSVPRFVRALAAAAFLLAGAAQGAELSLAADPIIPGAVATPRPAGAPPSAHAGRFGPLTPAEMGLARLAWRYFQNNTQARTGLANAANAYPSTSLWDVASYFGAVIAARELGIISPADAQMRLRKALQTLAGLKLFRDQCPNKAYNTASGEMVTYKNEPGEIGCSALDVGRLLIWLSIVGTRNPELMPEVQAVVTHLNPGSMVRDGVMFGASVGAKNETLSLQEGRLGYEQYAAKGFRIWGYDVASAARPEPHAIVTIYGVAIPYDTRDPRVLGAHNYVVTEGYALDGIEFGWNAPGDPAPDPFVHSDGWMAATAQHIYSVQERRFQQTGILTARTEHQLKSDPYFVYDTIYSDGRPWATITDTGRFVPEFAAVAVKGAIGLWALWNTPYTDRLFEAVRQANDPDKGLYEGILEKGGNIEEFTANNNGIVLETLLYKVIGRLYRPAR